MVEEMVSHKFSIRTVIAIKAMYSMVLILKNIQKE